MKFIVIGAGASGIAAAINLKRRHINDDVFVIEQLEKPLKKILATGNGKCNLGNENINLSLFRNKELARKTLDNYNYKNFFESISIKTKLIGDLAYPVSESAVSVREALLNEADRLGIKISTNETLLDYNLNNGKIIVTTNINTYKIDSLILAGGLKSSPKLGSDGSVINILEKHGYKINKLEPGLSPIYTKEKTNTLDGVRCKAKVTLINNKKIIHEEFGEVLFKEHGLSGIVIFNCSSYIARTNSNNVQILLDLLPDYTALELNDYYIKNGINKLLLAFINPKISDYLKKRFTNEKDILKALKSLEFNFDKSYGYDFSQVTVGGIDSTMIKENFESTKEKNVYIIGELIDQDGPCGGYNLTWAFASAQKIGK